MAIDVTNSIEVARARAEVAAFMFDPANDLRWIRALVESRPLSEGEVGTGMRVRRVARMPGRKVDYTTEVVGYEPERRMEMRTVEGPFAMEVTYALEDAPGGGTRVTVRNRGGSGFLFAVARPLIARMVRGRVQGDLEALKRALQGAVGS